MSAAHQLVWDWMPTSFLVLGFCLVWACTSCTYIVTIAVSLCMFLPCCVQKTLFLCSNPPPKALRVLPLLSHNYLLRVTNQSFPFIGPILYPFWITVKLISPAKNVYPPVAGITPALSQKKARLVTHMSGRGPSSRVNLGMPRDWWPHVGTKQEELQQQLPIWDPMGH